MFHRRELFENYIVFWLCALVFVGLTKWGKLLLGIAILVWFGTLPMVQYRIPTNEARTAYELREIQKSLRTSHKPAKQLSDLIDPERMKDGQLHQYVLGYTPRFDQDGKLLSYSVNARPSCYCQTGRRSFLMEPNGSIHYTSADRPATVSDPILSD